MNQDKPIISSGLTEFVATGTVLGLGTNPIRIYLPKYSLNIDFEFDKTNKESGITMKADDPNRRIVFTVSNPSRLGPLNGPTSPIRLGEVGVGQDKKIITMSFRLNVMTSEQGFILYYGIYAEPEND